MKNILMIGGVISLFIFGGAIFNSQKQKPIHTVDTITVPLPQETDIIRTFFNLIDEEKASEAVMMMSKNIISDESSMQAYGVQYAAMNSIKLRKLEESSRGDWNENKHQYIVTLDIEMNLSSANGPIPFYGYANGENIRFINLIKEDGKWKIEGLATGP